MLFRSCLVFSFILQFSPPEQQQTMISSKLTCIFALLSLLIALSSAVYVNPLKPASPSYPLPDRPSVSNPLQPLPIRNPGSSHIGCNARCSNWCKALQQYNPSCTNGKSLDSCVVLGNKVVQAKSQIPSKCPKNACHNVSACLPLSLFA